MRIKPMRRTAVNGEHLASTNFRRILSFIEGNMTGHYINCDSVTGRMLRNALAGTKAQKHEPKAWLVHKDFRHKANFIELDELLEIELFHRSGPLKPMKGSYE